MADKKAEAPEASEPTFAARRGEAGSTIGYTAADGSQRELKADGRGWFHPEDAEAERVLRDSFGLLTPSEAETAEAAQAEQAAAAVATGAPETPAAGQGE